MRMVRNLQGSNLEEQKLFLNVAPEGLMRVLPIDANIWAVLYLEANGRFTDHICAEVPRFARLLWLEAENQARQVY